VAPADSRCNSLAFVALPGGLVRSSPVSTHRPPLSRAILGALTILAIGVAPNAQAKTLVIAPLGGADAKAVSNVTSMMSSELSFMAGVDDVVELKSASVNAGCLASASCLGGLVKSGPGDQLVTGTLTQNGTKYALDLVLFDGATNKMVRRKKFELPATPEGVADGMNAVVRELFTGATSGAAPAAPAAAASKPSNEEDFSFDEEAPKPAPKATTAKAPPKPAPAKPASSDDDFDIDLSGVDLEAEDDEHAEAARAEEAAANRAKADAAAKARVAEEKRKAEEDARRKAEEDARRKAEAEAARRKAEEEARIAAAKEAAARDAAAREAAREAARRKAEEDARKRAPAADDDFDPNAISFGKSKVEDDEVNRTIQFSSSKSSLSDDEDAPAKSKPSSYDDDEEPAPKKSRSSSYDEEDEDEPAPRKKPVILDEDDEDEPAPRKKPVVLDEDEDDRGARKTRASAFDEPKSKRQTNDEDDRPSRTGSKRDAPKASRFQIAARGGYSRYYDLNFITAGAEIAIGVTPTVYLVGGIDTYTVQRQIPPYLQRDNQTTEWNTIFPGSFGLQFKAPGKIRPYVGADGMAVPYYFDANGQGSMAFGARARFGCDFMVAEHFGLNLNGSVGFWSGKNWVLIQQGMGTLGVLPQVSAGTVIAF
jgi:hypothetical protein